MANTLRTKIFVPNENLVYRTPLFLNQESSLRNLVRNESHNMSIDGKMCLPLLLLSALCVNASLMAIARTVRRINSSVGARANIALESMGITLIPLEYFQEQTGQAKES